LALRIALVLGGAATLWDDIAAALDLGEFVGVVACNDAGATWPGDLDAWVSLHSSSFKLWTARRARAGHPPAKRLVGHAEARGENRDGVSYTEFRFPGQDKTGSSGLFALKVALIDLGFDRAVLCGVPMTVEDRHFFDPAPWRGAMSHRKGWEQALPQIKDRARSMSGWTKEHLGAPTPEWLAQ
jgi:hypothetical protein